jgi:hypothetical protein
MAILGAIYDIAIFSLNNYEFPNQNNYLITKLSHLLLVLKHNNIDNNSKCREDSKTFDGDGKIIEFFFSNPSMDDAEYSTDSEYEEQTGIRRKYTPKNKPEPISREITEMFREISQERKNKLSKEIISNLEKGKFSWTYFFDCGNNKLFGIIANTNKINIIGVIKDMRYKVLNYYFRRQVFITQQNKEQFHEFHTSINAYNAVFTPCNILKEYPDLILDDELKTEFLGMFNINKTRDEWIHFLKGKHKNDDSDAYYNYLC